VIIQVQHGGWQKYKVVKTDSQSRWNAAVVATFGKGTLYRTVVGSTRHEVATASGIHRFYKVRTSRSAHGATTPRA
jgi:hypothetical protein